MRNKFQRNNRMVCSIVFLEWLCNQVNPLPNQIKTHEQRTSALLPIFRTKANGRFFFYIVISTESNKRNAINRLIASWESAPKWKKKQQQLFVHAKGKWEKAKELLKWTHNNTRNTDECIWFQHGAQFADPSMVRSHSTAQPTTKEIGPFFSLSLSLRLFLRLFSIRTTNENVMY